MVIRLGVEEGGLPVRAAREPRGSCSLPLLLLVHVLCVLVGVMLLLRAALCVGCGHEPPGGADEHRQAL